MNVLPLRADETDALPASLPGPCKVAVVVPCYRVSQQICDVIRRIGPEVHAIYCVDDHCPEDSGERIAAECEDHRLTILVHTHNRGVGGAMITGFEQALRDGATIVVKLDGDGQMDPAMIGRFVRPIVIGRADYTKGNRFFRIESLREMPRLRLFGNAILSFFTKLSSGYWHSMDPANGFVAIHARVLAQLPLEKINQRYFFESDMLFRLNTLGAVVEDVPMDAHYARERSSLRIRNIWLTFLLRNLGNAAKRIFYNHFLRNFSVASIQLVFGIVALLFGLGFGLDRWWHSITVGVPVTSGTVMLAGLPVIVGTQLLLSFLGYDMQTTPHVPLHKRL